MARQLAGFRYACINAMQLGLQGGEFAKPTDLGSLRANRVDPACVPEPDQFMPIRVDYEEAAENFWIIDFVPHPLPCDCATVCTGGCGP